jgi:hypothetical protein
MHAHFTDIERCICVERFTDVEQNPVEHWRHAKPDPKMTFTPTFATTASVQATATASVVPTLTAHFDKILSYQIVVSAVAVAVSVAVACACLHALPVVFSLHIAVPFGGRQRRAFETRPLPLRFHANRPLPLRFHSDLLSNQPGPLAHLQS